MSRVIAAAALLVAGFVAGAWATLELVDRLLGGKGPRIQLAVDDEPGGGWER